LGASPGPARCLIASLKSDVHPGVSLHGGRDAADGGDDRQQFGCGTHPGGEDSTDYWKDINTPDKPQARAKWTGPVVVHWLNPPGGGSFHSEVNQVTPRLPRGPGKALFLFLLFLSSSWAQGIISTVAGTNWIFPDDGKPGAQARLTGANGMAFDSQGNLYFAVPDLNMVMKLDTNGIVRVVAGTGLPGFSGDGVPARTARLTGPWAVALDAAGNIYVADSGNGRVRKIDSTGMITTVAGGGPQFPGDGLTATQAGLQYPQGVAFDPSGNMLIVDSSRLRKVNAAGIISTVAGNGTSSSAGDGGQASNATLSGPDAIAVASDGSIYIAEHSGNIRRIAPNGIINTYAGGGNSTANGVPAATAAFNRPSALALDAQGNLYIAEEGGARVRKVTNGLINTVAGTGQPGFSGDTGIATGAQLAFPNGLAVDASGNLFIADHDNNRIRRVDSQGNINTVAGAGDFTGDGGPAIAARLAQPNGIAVDSQGSIYIADFGAEVVRKVTPDGLINTFAGTGQGGSSLIDNVAATSSILYQPFSVAVDRQGNVYIADARNFAIRKVDTSGKITTLVDPSIAGHPTNVAVDSKGNVYFNSQGTPGDRVQKLSGGTVTFFAGTGAAGTGGDGGLAVNAQLGQVEGLAVDASDNLYISDGPNNVVRRVDTNGNIRTVAGNGQCCDSGDGGLATSASLNFPEGLAVDTAGNLYIATQSRVRRVSSSGSISTWAGTGVFGFSGDGGLASAATFSGLRGLALDGAGNVYVVDSGNYRVRQILAIPPVQSCAFGLTPASANFAAGGGPGSISVTASRTDCAWTVTSNVSWITFTSNTGTGNGTQNYTVAANPGATSRIGTITIADQTVTVNQGGVTCTYSLPAASQAFGPAAGSGTAAVQAPPGCTWTATSGVSWITIAPGAGGSGNGTVTYNVSANPSPTARAGTLTIANQPYNVSQTGSGSTLSCTASVPSAPQVALEGRTEVMGDFVLNCAGLSGSLKADIALTLNTNVTNMLTNGVADAVLTVNGSPQNGLVAGYNIIRWPGVSLAPAADATASARISKVRADASMLATTGQQAAPITGRVTISALAPVPIAGALQTVATAAPSLVFTKYQPSSPAGGPQTSVPLLFQEAQATSFHAGSTRLRLALTNVPGTVQVYAPVYPAEGASQAQLYSADANGLGGSPLAGSPMAGGVYQQLTVTGGTATATWLVMAADPTKVETWTFPLLVVNAATSDLNQILIAGSLAPVSDVSIASATAPVPRFRDFSAPQKLVNLRVSTSVQVPPQAAALDHPGALAAKAPMPRAAIVGTNVTFVSGLLNDTTDPSQTATNVVVRDNLPTGLNYVSCSATGGATCSGSGNQIQVSYATLGPGQGATVTVVAQVDPSVEPGTVVENPVSAASDQANLDLLASTSSSSFIALLGTPGTVESAPAAGAGYTQTFTFQFSHSSGYQALGVVNVLFNTSLDGRKACYLAYVSPANTLYLVDDAGDAGGPYAGYLVLGSAGTIQNSQCAVNLVSAVGLGDKLTLSLNITFKQAFGGNQITYVAARDQGQGNTNWQAAGVWQVPIPHVGTVGVTGVTPSRGAAPAGTAQSFVFTFTDTQGTGDFGVINVLVNNALDGRKACYVAYEAFTGNLFLVDDAGDAGGPFAGEMSLNGGSTSVQNGQCSIAGTGSTAAFSPNTLALTLNITFTAAFQGNRVVYAAGRDRAGGNNTDWQAVGSWTVQ